METADTTIRAFYVLALKYKKLDLLDLLGCCLDGVESYDELVFVLRSITKEWFDSGELVDFFNKYKIKKSSCNIKFSIKL